MHERDKTNRQPKEQTGSDKPAGKPEKSRLEKIAQAIDPSGREISNQDLSDPGRMTPGAPPTDNRS